MPGCWAEKASLPAGCHCAFFGFFLLVYSFLIQAEFTTAVISKYEMIEQYLLVCGCFLLKMILFIAQEPQQQMKSVITANCKSPQA